MDKLTLIDIYETKLNHIELTYASLVLWSYPDMPDVFKSIHSTVLSKRQPQVSTQYPQLAELIDNDLALQIATDKMYASAHHSAINDLLPITKQYCLASNQLDVLTSQTWYPFWEAIRKSWSHDLRLKFRNQDKAHLPVSWAGLTIDMSLHGRQLVDEKATYQKLRDLIQEAYFFILDELD